jgi:hypothetical protein
MENQQDNIMTETTAPDRVLNGLITVIDLDGCVSDDRWRQQRIKKDAKMTNEDWDHYHIDCDKDPVLEPGAGLLRGHIDEGDYIIFATGRPHTVADKSSEWIVRNFGIKAMQDFTLIMRGPEDHRNAVILKNEMVTFIARHAMQSKRTVKVAYDDRPDVVEMYIKNGIEAKVVDSDGIRAFEEAKAVAEDVAAVERILSEDRARQDYNDVPTILQEMGDLFRERNGLYGNSGINVGAVMSALFPNGANPRTAADFRMFSHLERIVAKLVRFVNSGMTHEDSIKDLAVYAAMVAAEVDTK